MENGKEGAFACPDNGTEYRTTWQGQVGLTKREYFAVMAMQGLLSCPDIAASREAIAEESVKQADELLKALETK